MQFLLNDQIIPLSGYSLIRVVGQDSCSFLQGQLTQDINSIHRNTFKECARLDRSGRLQFYFYVINNVNGYEIFIHSDQAVEFKNVLTKYVVSEEVEFLNPVQSPYSFYIGQIKNEASGIRGLYGNFEGYLVENIELEIEKPNHSSIELSLLSFVSAFADKEYAKKEKELLNYSILSKTAVSTDKGCYLGQETFTKILKGKEVAKFPYFIEVEDKNLFSELQALFKNQYFIKANIGNILEVQQINEQLFLLVKLDRTYCVEGLNLQIAIGDRQFNGKVRSLLYFPKYTFNKNSELLYEMAIKSFHLGDFSAAKSYLNRSLIFNPINTNSIEVMGVILGKEKLYLEAITWMDKLSAIDSKSIMAHTNKSLFYMNLGQIKEAEDEKAKATLLNFEILGEEAEKKKIEQAKSMARKEELKRKASMFSKILEIDPNDEFALLNLAEINLEQNNPDVVINLLESVVNNSKFSAKGHLLLANTYLTLNKNNLAHEVTEQGLIRAKEKSEMQIYAALLSLKS